MNFYLHSLLGFVLFTSFSAWAGDLKTDPALTTVVSQCKASPQKDAKKIYFIKQWHLAPGVDTHAKEAHLPQEKNQKEIYLQLDGWMKQGMTQVIAEGCSGELNSKSTLKMNGWTIEDLQKKSGAKDYPSILTSIPMKIEAKYGSKVMTLCGDQDELIKEQLIAFSDARGDIGYLSRLVQYESDPVRVKTYLEGAIESFQLSKTATVKDAIQATKADLKKAVARIHDMIEKRNQSLAKVIHDSKEKQIVVVYGGMHAEGVKLLLEKEADNCLMIEPKSYQNDEANLLEQLEQTVEQL